MLFRDFILQMFKSNSELTVKEITAKSRQSRQMAHIAILQLIAARKIERIGHPPKTFYRLLRDSGTGRPNPTPWPFSPQDQDFLQNNFLVVTESGELQEGASGFAHYCARRSLPLDKTFTAYRKARERCHLFRDLDGLIEGTFQLIGTIPEENIRFDAFQFLDYNSIGGFGRSRLGTLLYYAKVGQNRTLMRMLMDSISEPFKKYLNRVQPEAVAFIPPIVPREVQLMSFIETQLGVSLPRVEIKKNCGTIAVPQQSLMNVDERIRNAGNIFAVSERRKFNHLLLIDDDVASGSTLNQLAAKIKDKGIATTVSGLAIICSTDDFVTYQPDQQKVS